MFYSSNYYCSGNLVNHSGKLIIRSNYAWPSICAQCAKKGKNRKMNNFLNSTCLGFYSLCYYKSKGIVFKAKLVYELHLPQFLLPNAFWYDTSFIFKYEMFYFLRCFSYNINMTIGFDADSFSSVIPIIIHNNTLGPYFWWCDKFKVTNS